MRLDRIKLVTGDDKPKILFQFFRKNTNNPKDLSASALTVLANFREQNTDIVIMQKTCSKERPTLGISLLEFTKKALDQVGGAFEIEWFTSASNTTGTITGATQANPVVITSAAHGLVAGDEIQIESIVGMTELNDKRFFVVEIDANRFSLQDGADSAINGTSFTAYVSGGTFTKYDDIETSVDILPIKLKEDF